MTLKGSNVGNPGLQPGQSQLINYIILKGLNVKDQDMLLLWSDIQRLQRCS
jgi:hypothetical protein